MALAKRLQIETDPFGLRRGPDWRAISDWPAQWIMPAHPGMVNAFRTQIKLAVPKTLRLHVTADERYELFLNGERIGRGAERGCPTAWFFDSYEVELPAGSHTLSALQWALGDRSPDAQMSVRPGFLCAIEGESLKWEAKLVSGVSLSPPASAHWRGFRISADLGGGLWEAARGLGQGWAPAKDLGPGQSGFYSWERRNFHRLQPGMIGGMIDRPWPKGTVRRVSHPGQFKSLAIPYSASEDIASDRANWQALWVQKKPLTIPAQTRLRVLVDLEDYVCGYVELMVRGGNKTKIRLHWAEALKKVPDPYSAEKGHRDEVDGKFFVGEGDEFLLDGERREVRPLWFHAGRYVELAFETAAEPLIIESARVLEVRAPVEMESAVRTNEPKREVLRPILVRGLQASCHETFADSPHYEEMMYAGDSRLEALMVMAVQRDHRLARKAVRLFGESIESHGMAQSRFPCHVPQIIAPYALVWVDMIRDLMEWRGDYDLVKSVLPGARFVIDSWLKHIQPNGQLLSPEGWNFTDWTPEWDPYAGADPGGVAGYSSILAFQLCYTLEQIAWLEDRHDEPALATRWRSRARELARTTWDAFFDPKTQRLADGLDHRQFSEHAAIWAILSGSLSPERTEILGRQLKSPGLIRATYYFSHYYIEACRRLGWESEIHQRLADWDPMLNIGLKAPLEKPEPSRTDCHGWSSHPLLHEFITIAGIRPASPGFKTVRIQPHYGPITDCAVEVVHPSGGIIRTSLKEEQLLIELPPGVSGHFRRNGQELPLQSGRTVLSWKKI